jgi:hypothetical protein
VFDQRADVSFMQVARKRHDQCSIARRHRIRHLGDKPCADLAFPIAEIIDQQRRKRGIGAIGHRRPPGLMLRLLGDTVLLEASPAAGKGDNRT